MSALRLFLLAAVLAAACGGGPDYAEQASALCREFNADAAEGPGDERARELYARLRDGLTDLSPPQELRRSHNAMVTFARDGEALLAALTTERGATPDALGDWATAQPQVERDLPDCADSLAIHPEIQVIR